MRLNQQHFFTLVLGLWSSVALAQAEPEPVPRLLASNELPEHMRAGPHHRVLENVTSDGFTNYYDVESDFGTFRAAGNLMLFVLLQEFEAIAELERVSETEVFAEAAIQAGLSPAKAVISFVNRPVATIKGLPRGIGRMFRNLARTGKEGLETASDFLDGDESTEHCEEFEDETTRKECESLVEERNRSKSLHERYFKISEAERRWHEELGTDPYTSNDALYEAVKSVAWADRLGRFAVKFTGRLQIPGASYISDANKLVWSKDPYELEKYNKKVLQQAGIDEELQEAFFGNLWFSPTMRTRFIAALVSLENAHGRQHVLRAAIAADSVDLARYILESVVAMTWYNTTHSPITEFVGDTHFPVAITENGRLLVFMAVDHMFWTESVAFFGPQLPERFPDLERGQFELRLFGRVSERAREQLEALGWQVHENQLSAIRESATY